MSAAASHQEPVVVISDVHLSQRCRWEQRVEGLRPLWAGTGTIVFNGDTITGMTATDLVEGQRIVDRLVRLCAADGTEAVFLAGNSDHNLVAARHLDLAGGRVVVTHGDAIFPSVCPWRDWSGRLAGARQAALAKMSPARRDTLEGQLASASQAVGAVDSASRTPGIDRFGNAARVASLLRHPRRLWALLRAWREAPRLAGQFLKQYRPHARVMVMGHTHLAGIWSVEDRIVVNTGSLEGPGRILLARVAAGELVVQQIRRRRRRYGIGKTVASLPL